MLAPFLYCSKTTPLTFKAMSIPWLGGRRSCHFVKLFVPMSLLPLVQWIKCFTFQYVNSITSISLSYKLCIQFVKMCPFRPIGCILPPRMIRKYLSLLITFWYFFSYICFGLWVFFSSIGSFVWSFVPWFLFNLCGKYQSLFFLLCLTHNLVVVNPYISEVWTRQDY